MCLSAARVDVLDVPAISLPSLSKQDIIGAKKQDNLCKYVIMVIYLMESVAQKEPCTELLRFQMMYCAMNGD